MMFDTMQPEFIRLLPVYGTLCIIFLLAFVRAGVQSNGQLSSRLKAGAYLSLAAVFAIAFIGTTAPSQNYYEFLRILLVCSCIFCAIICAAAAAIYLRTSKAFFEPVIHYKDFLDDIDDYVFVFDASGEQVLHNNPKGKEELFPANAGSLQTAAGRLEKTCSIGVFSDGTEQKITVNNCHFIVNESVIRDKKDREAGAVLIFHDITEEQELIDELEAKNVLIIETNSELMQMMDIDEALLAQEEREKIAAEIRQELELKMNETLRFIDALRASAHEDRVRKEQYLRSLAGQLRGVLADIRKIVYQTKEYGRRNDV